MDHGMIDDHNRCEWVNVFFGSGLSGLSQTKLEVIQRWSAICRV